MKALKLNKIISRRKRLANLLNVWMCAVPFICVCVCVHACMSVPTCVTSGRAIMLDTGMTMITVCHALTRGDEGPGGCSLCHDKPRTRPVTPSTPQTPATTPHPRTHSHPCTPPNCSHVQPPHIEQTQNLIKFWKSILRGVKNWAVVVEME